MVYSINKIDKISCDINSLCDRIDISLSEDKWDDAHSSSEELIELWEKKSKSMFVYVNIGELDHISSEIIRLNTHTQLKEKNEAILCISEIKYLINEINALESLTFHNIF